MQKPLIDAVPDPVSAVSGLLDHLYAGIEQPARWRCLLDELAPMLGLRHLAFIIFRAGIYSLEVRSGTPRAVLDRLRNQYQGENLIRTTPMRNGRLLTGALLDSRNFLAPGVVESSEFHRDIMKPAGVDYVTMAVASGIDAPLEPEIMLVLGHGTGEDLTPARRSLMQALLPHLRRAVLMQMAVDFRDTAGTHTGMQAVPRGHLLVDQHERPAQSGESVDSLATACRLTGKERLVLEGLSRGLNLREIAADRGVSFNTVRAQLRSIYAKTGIRSQRELILRLKR